MTMVRKLLDLLTARERKQAYLLVPLVLAMAMAEVAGIASVAPFLSLIADPEAARTNAVLAWAYDAFGFESDRSFLIAAGLLVMVTLIGANALQGIIDAIDPHMTLDTRFYRTVTSFVKQFADGLDSKKRWAETAEGMERPATVAQQADELNVGTSTGC